MPVLKADVVACQGYANCVAAHDVLIGTRDVPCRPEVVAGGEPFGLAATWADPDGCVTGNVTIIWPRESVRLRTPVARGGAA